MMDVLQINKEYRYTFSIKNYDTFIRYTQGQKIGMPNNLKKWKKT